MRFQVNETAGGVVKPDKDICKVQGCGRSRFKSRKPRPFCKLHSGLRHQMSRVKLAEFTNNDEVVIDVAVDKSVPRKRTSKKNQLKALRKQLLG
jgi:hypothetical protein